MKMAQLRILFTGDRPTLHQYEDILALYQSERDTFCRSEQLYSSREFQHRPIFDGTAVTGHHSSLTGVEAATIKVANITAATITADIIAVDSIPVNTIKARRMLAEVKFKATGKGFRVIPAGNDMPGASQETMWVGYSE